jgi:hypothetical protein
LSAGFSKVYKINFSKIFSKEAEVFHEDRRRKRHDKANVRFLKGTELKYKCNQLVKAELSNIRPGGTYGI